MSSPATILLDTNAYLRLGYSLHPLLAKHFGSKGNRLKLRLTGSFLSEYSRSPRIQNKFPWVNQPEYINDRKKGRLRVPEASKPQIKRASNYLWQFRMDQGLTASRVDVNILAHGYVLDIVVVTDDKDMKVVGEEFEIQIMGVFDLLKLMFECDRATPENIKALAGYLEYIKDTPSITFKEDCLALIGGS